MTGEPGVKIDLEDALNHVDQMRLTDSEEGVANALMRLAVAYIEREKYNLAFEALDEAHFICQRLENDLGRAHVCVRLSEVAQVRGQWDEAEERLEEALKVFREAGEVAGQVSALERLGRLFAKTGRLGQAASSLKKALALVQKGGDLVGQVLLEQQLAPIYRNQGQWKKAAEAYLELGRLAEALGDRQRLALALVGVGTCRAGLGELAQGLAAFKQACEVFTNLGQLNRAAQVSAEMRRWQAAADKNRKAEENG